MINLRPYQEEAATLLRRSFKKGNRRVILCAPTGAGKTVIFSDIAKKTADAGKRVLILTDRIELLKQGTGALSRIGLETEQIKAGQKLEKINYKASAFVAMVETFNRRLSNKVFTSYLGKIDLLIIDEAHKGNFRKILDQFPNTFTIGATATPISGSKAHPLNEYYSDIVENTSIPELIGDGYLVRSRTYAAAEKISASSLQVKRGEYTDKSQFSAFDKKEHYTDCVDKYRHFCQGKKALVFNINIEHSLKVLESFREAGIPSAHLDGETPERERNQILEDFNSGRILVLCNVGVLTTGYDEPSIECIILNRKTKSLPLYLQMVGRGSRLYPGKEYFTVLDMGYNFEEFGTWDEPRSMSEVFFNPHKPNKKKDVAPGKECKKCGAINALNARVCIVCENPFPKPKPNIEEIVGAHFEEVTPDEILRKSPKEWSFEDILAIQKIKGYRPGWIYYQLAERGLPFLKQYAELKGYKKGWSYAQMKRFNKLDVL